MSWRLCLQDCVNKEGARPSAKSDREEKQKQQQEELALFTQMYEEQKSACKSKSSSSIPRFYFKLPTDDEVLLQKLREESRAVFLQRKSRELLGKSN